jgi:hypothetical protein
MLLGCQPSSRRSRQRLIIRQEYFMGQADAPQGALMGARSRRLVVLVDPALLQFSSNSWRRHILAGPLIRPQRRHRVDYLIDPRIAVSTSPLERIYNDPSNVNQLPPTSKCNGNAFNHFLNWHESCPLLPAAVIAGINDPHSRLRQGREHVDGCWGAQAPVANGKSPEVARRAGFLHLVTSPSAMSSAVACLTAGLPRISMICGSSRSGSSSGGLLHGTRRLDT